MTVLQGLGKVQSRVSVEKKSVWRIVMSAVHGYWERSGEKVKLSYKPCTQCSEVKKGRSAASATSYRIQTRKIGFSGTVYGKRTE